MELVRAAVRAGEVRSAHDVAEGGLAVALAESALAGGIGARVDLRAVGGATCQAAPLDAQLFGEGPCTFVLSGPRAALDELCASAPAGVAARVVGEVGGDTLELAHADGTLSWPLEQLRRARDGGLTERIGEMPTA
jgi:phosphoribosylformylglycinamidine synthase